MMSYRRSSVAVLLGLFVSAGVARSDDATLTGKILCAKCSLKETSQCTTAIQVNESGKTVTYYFADKGVRESYHSAVCGSGSKDGRVTGSVTEKNGKRWITPKKVEYLSKNDSSLAPSWQRDYALAQEAGRRAGKPLAIFFGPGTEGWTQVARAGELPPSASSLLREQYVCLHLDTATTAGKGLADAFEVKQGVGLVLSDRACENQAFHHCGTLADQDLVASLQRCCSQGGASCAGGNCNGAGTPTAAGAARATTPVTTAGGGSCCGRR